LEQYPTKESRRGLVQRLNDLGLEVSGYSSDFTMCNPTVQRNAARYLDLFRRTIELCADVGSPMIRVDTISAPGSIEEDDYQPSMDRIAALWRDAAGIAEKAGVRLLWEFEPGFVFNKPSEIAEICEKVGHPNFGLVFDTCHAYMCAAAGSRQYGKKETLKGGITELLAMLRDWVRHVHLVDSDGTLWVDETSRHLPMGKGCIDFEVLAPELATIPAIDWWCIDHAFMADAWDRIESSLTTVRKLAAAPGA
jgi:sugar phosphate isomerase/epimerase